MYVCLTQDLRVEAAKRLPHASYASNDSLTNRSVPRQLDYRFGETVIT